MTCFPDGSAEKNLPANVDFEMQETWVQSLGGEDPLEEGMAIHFSILAWKIPRIEDLGCYRPQGCKELDTNEQLNMHTVVQILLVLCLTNGETSLLLLFSHPILSDSLRPHGLYTPRNCLGQNTGVGSVSILQGIFLTPTYWKSQLENSCFLFHFK